MFPPDKFGLGCDESELSLLAQAAFCPRILHANNTRDIYKSMLAALIGAAESETEISASPSIEYGYYLSKCPGP